MALVDHATGAPAALLGFADEGGERAAMHDLLERADIRGRTVTLDALRTVRRTARLITELCGADYVMAVKANAPETFALLKGVDWERRRDGFHAEEPAKGHGRLERRTIDVVTPLPGAVNYPGVRQIARVRRRRERLGPAADGAASVETAYLITSLDAQAAPPAQLLALNRGHWAVENGNHRVRDTTLGEDACLARTGNGPLNRASLNNIALAVVFANRRGGVKTEVADVKTLIANREASLQRWLLGMTGTAMVAVTAVLIRTLAQHPAKTQRGDQCRNARRSQSSDSEASQPMTDGAPQSCLRCNAIRQCRPTLSRHGS